MHAVGQAAANPRAATWRDVFNQVVNTTWGGTICWFPRKPSAFAAVSDDGGYESVLRCGWCSGCREFDRRRLAKRLHQHFASWEGELWLTIVECPLKLQTTMARRFRRATGSTYERGFLRLGEVGIALIARGSRPKSPATSSRWRVSFRHERLRRSRGLRAWRPVTQGMLVSRDDYGEHTDRFYLRGLAPAEREHWRIETRAGIRKRHDGLAAGVRAVCGELGLMPPEAWRPLRLIRRRGVETERVARGDRGLVAINQVIANLTTGSPLAFFPLSRAGEARSAVTALKTSVAAEPPPPLLRPTDQSLIGGVTEVVSHSSRAGFIAWGERMAKKARDRGGG